jgi:hypothetical protein
MILLMLSGKVDVIEGLEEFEELIAWEGIAIMVTIIAIVNADAAIATIFFMT